MDDAILITELNDFIFCPVSIYFHKLYGNTDKMLYQSSKQIDGTAAHKNVDMGVYSSRKNIFMGTDVYCEKYRLVGKIDIYDGNKRILRERKKKIKQIYDGYIFQVYAQYFALEEMGYPVEKIELYSMDDHKTYEIDLPRQNIEIFRKFEDTVYAIREFQIRDFVQINPQKCKYCIYEPACDRSLI